MSLQKNPRLLIPKLLKLADGIPCGGCGRQDGSVVMAHSNAAIHGKAKGRKAHDCFVAALCGICHTWLDSGTVSYLVCMDGEIYGWEADRIDKLEFFRRSHDATFLYLWRNGLITC